MPDSSSEPEAMAQAYARFLHRPLMDASFAALGVADLHRNEVAHLAETVKTSDRFQKILLIGHSGVGKSTLLGRVCRDEALQARNYPVRVSPYDTLNMMDVEAIDLLLALYMALLKAMPAADIDPSFDDFQQLVDPVAEEFDVTESGFAYLDAVSFRIKTDYAFRQALRRDLKPEIETLQRHVDEACRHFSRHTYECFKLTRKSLAQLREEEVSDKVLTRLAAIEGQEYKSEVRFLRAIEEQIGDIQTLHYKPLLIRYGCIEEPRDALIFMDDLDKLPWNVFERLFFEEIHLFTMIDARILFTFPAFAAYSPLFFHIGDSFLQEHVWPVREIARTGEPHETHTELLREMVTRRIAADQITGDALAELISRSGGLLRDLTALLREACRSAVEKNATVIDRETAVQAVDTLAQTCSRFFDASRYGAAVSQVRKSHSISGLSKKKVMYLLRYHFLLACSEPDGTRWFDVHPFLKHALDR